MIPPPVLPAAGAAPGEGETSSPNVQPTQAVDASRQDSTGITPPLNISSGSSGSGSGSGAGTGEQYWTVAVDSVHDSTQAAAARPEMTEESVSLQDPRYHFLLEKEGYILSRWVGWVG